MKKTKISVTVITFNEEKNLPRCLASVKEMADEIVVVDSGSKDETVEIAKEYGAKVYFRKFDGFADQKNYAIGKTTGDWIYSLDADEVTPKELGDEILKAVNLEEFDGYLIPRRNIILGKEIRYARWSPDEHIWLWRRGKGQYFGGVHAEARVEGKVGRLKNGKIHFHYGTVAEFLEMLNKYTDSEAKEKIQEGLKFSYFMLFFSPALSLFRRFIYKKGFLDGWRGFVLSYLMAIYRMTTWIKVWERQKSGKLQSG